jgi:hypothetical protein
MGSGAAIGAATRKSRAPRLPIMTRLCVKAMGERRTAVDMDQWTKDESDIRPEHRILLWIAVGCVIWLFAAMAVISIMLWNQPDPTIAYVPVPILQWSFIGGVIAVLYQLAYRHNMPGVSLYIWVVTKPIIGMAMGALVYFLALGGVFILAPSFHTTPQPVVQAPAESNLPGAQQSNRPINVSIFLLNALAFMGGFSEQFSTGLIRRITSEDHAETTPRERAARHEPR